MKKLTNNFDNEINFFYLDEAKKYYYPTEETDKGVKDFEDFLGNPEEFGEYLEHWEEYKRGIQGAKNLEELATVLTEYADEFGNGSTWSVKEI